MENKTRINIPTINADDVIEKAALARVKDLDTLINNLIDNMSKASSGKNLTKYWKTQEALIEDVVQSCKNFNKVSNATNASNLLKATNALKAVHGIDLSDIIPDFGNFEKSLQSARNMIGNLDSAFDVSSFKNAFEVFENLKRQGLDVREIFHNLEAGSGAAQLFDDLNNANNTINKLTIKIKELQDKLDDSESGNGIKAIREECEDLRSEIMSIRQEAENTFSAFLTSNNIDADYYKYDEFFDKIRDGSLTAQEAIAEFKRDYAYLLDGNASFDTTQLQDFSKRLDGVSTKITEVSNKLDDITLKGVKVNDGDASGSLEELANIVREIENTTESTNTSAIYESLSKILTIIKEIGQVDTDNLYHLSETIRQLSKLDDLKINKSSLDNLADCIERICKIDKSSVLSNLSLVDFKNFNDLHISKASLNNLAEYLPRIANINVEKLIELTKVDFSNLNNFKIDKETLNNLKQFANSLSGTLHSNGVNNVNVDKSNISSASDIQNIESKTDAIQNQSKAYREWSDAIKYGIDRMQKAKELHDAGLLPYDVNNGGTQRINRDKLVANKIVTNNALEKGGSWSDFSNASEEYIKAVLNKLGMTSEQFHAQLKAINTIETTDYWKNISSGGWIRYGTSNESNVEKATKELNYKIYAAFEDAINLTKENISDILNRLQKEGFVGQLKTNPSVDTIGETDQIVIHGRNEIDQKIAYNVLKAYAEETGKNFSFLDGGFDQRKPSSKSFSTLLSGGLVNIDEYKEKLQETRIEAEKTSDALDKINNPNTSKTPIKDVFQGDDKVITDASTTAIKEESQALEHVSDSAKEAAASKEKFANANKEVKDITDASTTSLDEEKKKIENVGDSAEETKKKLDDVVFKPNTEGFDEIVAKFKLLQSESEQIVKIVKETKRTADGIDVSYKATLKNGSSYYLGESSNPQLLRASEVAYDAKAVEQEAKAFNQAWEEAIKVNNALNETKSILSSLPRTTGLDDEFTSLHTRLLNLNNDLTSGKISVSDYTKEVKNLTSSYSEMFESQQRQADNQKLEQQKRIYQELNDKINRYATIAKRIASKSAYSTDEEDLARLQARIEELRNEPLLSEEQLDKSQKKLDEIETTVEDIQKHVVNTTLDNLQGDIDKYYKNYDKYSIKPKDVDRNPQYTKDLEEYKSTIDKLAAEKERLAGLNLEFITEDDLKNVRRIESDLAKIEKRVEGYSAAEKGSDEQSRLKQIDKINKYLEENTRISQEAKYKLRELLQTLENDGAAANVKKINEEFIRITNNELAAGRAGKSFMDVLKDKKFYSFAGQIASYFSFYDIINVIRRGAQEVRELNKALTEMRKVSDESLLSLKEYQNISFDMGDEVGTTGKQIMESTADWLRLGESMKEASKSASTSNILLNVSEFESIDEATESLVSMSQAYKDLDKIEIVDVLNNLGNNYAISTDGLATALKDSASALKTAQNDYYEAAALATAANTVVQDPSKVGAGKFMPECIVICRYFIYQKVAISVKSQ